MLTFTAYGKLFKTPDLDSPIPSVKEVTSTSIQIQWANLKLDVDEIMVKYRARPVGSWITENTTQSTNSYNITELTPKVLYEIELELICNGQKCNMRNAKATSIKEYTSPIMPIEGQILEIFNKAVKVFWKYPISDSSPDYQNEYVGISLHSDRYDIILPEFFYTHFFT